MIARSAKSMAVLLAVTLVWLAPASPAGAAGCGWHAPVHVPKAGIFTVPQGIDARAGNDAWIVGWSAVKGVSGTLTRNYAAHWDGSSWKIVKPAHLTGSKNEQLSSVTMVSKNDVWAVGSYSNTSSDESFPEIQHWDGVRWSIVPSPAMGTSDALYDVAAISTDDVWATGASYPGGGTSLVLIEHWNGTRWRVVSHPFVGTDQTLADVARIPGTSRAWTVGYTGNGTELLTGRSAGTTWTQIPAPAPDTTSSRLYGVSPRSMTDAWAVGVFDSGKQTLVERWNGTDWSIVPSPNVGTEGTELVAVAAFSPTGAVAVGHRKKGPLDRVISMRWNGTAWKVIPFQNVGVASNGVVDMARIRGTSGAWATGVYSDLDSGRPFAERYC